MKLATPIATAVVPLTWNDIEWLRAAPAPIPEGNPDWVYDSMNGTIYGQAAHPDLLLDITVLQVNRPGLQRHPLCCGRYWQSRRQLACTGLRLRRGWNKYGDDAEVPYLSILDRLSVAEYDAVAAQIGLVPYAETYGTNGTSIPIQQREAEACAAAANAEAALPPLIHEYINAERAQEGLGRVGMAQRYITLRAGTCDRYGAIWTTSAIRTARATTSAARWAAWEHDECSTAGENLSRVSYGVDEGDAELTATA